MKHATQVGECTGANLPHAEFEAQRSFALKFYIGAFPTSILCTKDSVHLNTFFLIGS
jgi:hypothetical protein